MLLGKQELERYGLEITDLYQRELRESPTNGLTYFGIFLDNQTLQAVGAVRCYMGHWYLRGCIVKPEYRGDGLQRALIDERLAYLSKKTDIARVSVYPHNVYSIANIEASGFQFERKKKLSDGHEVLIYKYEMK